MTGKTILASIASFLSWLEIVRICPHLASSGFRRDGGQSLPNRAGLTRAGKKGFPATGGGKKMETAIRHQSANARSSLASIAPSSVAIDYAGIDEEEIDKKPKTIR